MENSYSVLLNRPIEDYLPALKMVGYPERALGFLMECTVQDGFEPRIFGIADHYKYVEFKFFVGRSRNAWREGWRPTFDGSDDGAYRIRGFRVFGPGNVQRVR